MQRLRTASRLRNGFESASRKHYPQIKCAARCEQHIFIYTFFPGVLLISDVARSPWLQPPDSVNRNAARVRRLPANVRTSTTPRRVRRL